MEASMKNVGRLDAGVRIALGIGLLGLAAVVNARPFLSIAAALGALLIIGTGLTRFCPLYTALGLGTRAKPRGV
jgi:hypothetical protein